MEDTYNLKKLKDDVYQFESTGKGSHIYLILGDRVNAIIDTGNYEKFNHFIMLLMTEVGIELTDINLVINTHSHWDHVSSNHFFKYKSLVAAHRFAATKMELNDEFVMRGKECGFDIKDLKAQLWLEDKMIFDLGGDCHLKIFHSPGHTSGSTADRQIRHRSKRIYRFSSLCRRLSPPTIRKPASSQHPL